MGTKLLLLGLVVVAFHAFFFFRTNQPMILLNEQPPQGKASASENHHSDPLPTCEELMQHPFSPFADGAFLTRKSTLVVWKMRPDGSRELTLPMTCRLKRYTANQAGKCLKNKNLLFVGDSLTRYQFLSFTYFLEHKNWPSRFRMATKRACNHVDEHGNKACSTLPNVCAEGDWLKYGGWPAFYQELGGGTDGAVYNGRMECQSVEDDPRVDNCRYISSKEDGRTRLSYASELGWIGTERFRGWNFTGCSHNATCRYTPERYKQNKKRLENNVFDWDYPNIITAFGPNGTTFQEQHPDTNFILYNRGLWGKIRLEKAKEMMASIYRMTGGGDKQSNRCFFKSTTGCQRSRDRDLDSWEYGPVRKAAYEAGCEFFDIAHVTAEFAHMLFHHPIPPRNLLFEYKNIFWDALHYVPWVYEELNTLLLNVLCNRQELE